MYWLTLFSALAAVTEANEVTIFRFILTSSSFHSGASVETCTPSYGGPLTAACTGGIASAHLIGRRLAEEAPLWIPPQTEDSAYKEGTLDELVKLESRTMFLPFLSESAVFDFIGGNWTPWCPVLATLNAPVALLTETAVTASTFACPDVEILEVAQLASATGLKSRMVQAHYDRTMRVAVVSTMMMGRGVTASGVALVGWDYSEWVAEEMYHEDPPFVFLINAATEAELREHARKIHLDGPFGLAAVISTVGEYMPTPVYYSECNCVITSVPVAAAPDAVALVEVAAPNGGYWEKDFLPDMRVYKTTDNNLSLTERTTDDTWLAAQAAARLGFDMYNQANPVVGTVAVPISATGPTEPAGCGFDDCAMGQYLASVLATSPPMFVEDLDLTAGSSEGSHAGSAPVADADKTPSDPGSPVALPADVALAHGGLHDGDGLPGGRLREADLSSRFAADTCRGRLRGLTVMRLLQASLDTAVGTASFLQFGGLRLGFLPADPTANRTRPTLVRAEVQNRSTGAFAPLVRTQLYSVAMTRATQGLPAFAPILDAPLLGDSVPCFAPGTANLRQLVRADVLANTPVAFAPADLIAADDETNYSAALAAGGLAAPDSAVVCAAKNALAGAPPDLVFDDGLASCVPCAAPLIPNAEADSCVAPPPPPPPPPPPDRTPAFIAGAGAIVIVCVVLGAAIAALLPMWRRRHCPVDPRQPFTVAYISTLNEAALRERHPDGVAKALRLIERTVAREAAAAGCVVARRLEAHHMIVAKDPARALRCAAAVLRALDVIRWAPVLLTAADEERRERIAAKLQVRRHSGASSFVSHRTGVTASHCGSRFSSVVDSSLEHRPRKKSSATVLSSASYVSDLRAPIVAAGLWHGTGTIERDEDCAEAFGYRYGGAVATCAAAAAMAARPWQVALPVFARVEAEDALWHKAGRRPADLANEDFLADFDDDELPGVHEKSVAGSSDGSSEDTAPSGTGADSALRLAPPQLGLALFIPGGELKGVPAATAAEAGSLSRDGAVVENLLLASLRSPSRLAREDLTTEALSTTASGVRVGGSRRRVGGGGAQAAVGNTLAAALSAASGRLASQRVGVVCVYVPALRASLPGVPRAALPALFDSTADTTAASRIAPDDIVAAAAGAAAHSRLVALLDGCMYFGINAPDVTTAQVPRRAVQDALSIAAAVAEITGALVSAGVAVGPAFVGAGQQTLAEREGVVKARPPPVALLGSAADRAQELARVALASGHRSAKESDDLVMVDSGPHESTTSPLPHVDDAVMQADTLLGLLPSPVSVVVAGDLAAELSSFELEVVDLIAWPASVACLLPVQRGGPNAALASADVRRRVALAVRVVCDRSESEIENDDGDGEWLYQVGAVGGKSAFAAVNAAAAALVRPLGVAADFALGAEDAKLEAALPGVFSDLQAVLRESSPAFAEQAETLALFAAHRLSVAHYAGLPYLRRLALYSQRQ